MRTPGRISAVEQHVRLWVEKERHIPLSLVLGLRLGCRQYTSALGC